MIVLRSYLSFSSDEMKSFFDPRVDSVLEMILAQRQDIEAEGRRAKVSRASY